MWLDTDIHFAAVQIKWKLWIQMLRMQREQSTKNYGLTIAA